MALCKKIMVTGTDKVFTASQANFSKPNCFYCIIFCWDY